MSSYIKNSSFSFYAMENNNFMGSCLVVVYHASDQEVAENGLTSPDLSLYIKTLIDVNDFKSVDDIGKKELFDKRDAIVLRVASECQFGAFGDSHCDCESQKQSAMQYMMKHQGIYVQMPQEAQGRGLAYKAAELQLQVKGLDQTGTFVGKKDIEQASEFILGTNKVDVRKFVVLKKVFQRLHLNRYAYTLISSNPQKVDELSSSVGVSICNSKDVSRIINIDNISEYLSKIYLKNFQLDRDDLRKIYEIILSSEDIPERAGTVILHIEDSINAGKSYGQNEDILLKIIKALKTKNNSKHIGLFEDLGNSRNEYQTELVVRDDQLSNLFKSRFIDGLSGLAYEENFFYTLGYLNGIRSQDLKIRRRSKVNPRSRERVIDDTIVYKIRMSNGIFMVRDMLVKDLDLANLMIFAFKSYEVSYVPVFTHTCEISQSFIGECSILVLLKRYTKDLRTLSLMGSEREVKKLIKNIEKDTGKLKEIPDPTNHTTVNKDLIFEFDYEELASEELNIFKQYYTG